MICGGIDRMMTPPPTISAYSRCEVEEYPDGGVRPRTIAARHDRMPTAAITGSPRILIGRSRSGSDRRSLIAAENMKTYMHMYRITPMSCSSAKADEVLGATTNTSDRIVAIPPCSHRIGICMPFLFVF